RPVLLDNRIEEARIGRLQPGGQAVQIYCAKDNLGYAGGINVTIRQLGRLKEWSGLWILNPDTEPDPNSLGAPIERARQGHYGLASSRLVLKSTGRVQSYGGRCRPLLARGLDIGRDASLSAVPDIDQTERSMSYVSGAALFATREYVESVGQMDE